MVKFLLQVVQPTSAKSDRKIIKDLEQKIGTEVILEKQVQFGKEVLVQLIEEDKLINIGAHKELLNGGSADVCIVADHATLGLKFIEFYEEETVCEEEEEMEEYVEECI